MDDKSNDPSTGFSYLLAEKNKLLVITLIGPLGESGIAQYEQCLEEISDLDYVVAVIGFREATRVDGPGLQFLANLQRALRKKSQEIGVCGLSPYLKEELTKGGVIRFSEIHDNLRDALIKLNAKFNMKKKTT